MNAKITATIAVAVVAAMVFAAAGAVTYSWFSDSEEANIDVNTATVKMDAKYKYCLRGTTPTDWMPVSGSDVDINNVTPNKTIDFTVGNYNNTSTIPVKYYLFVEIIAGANGIQAGHLILDGKNVPALSAGVSQKYLIDDENVAVGAVPGEKSFTIATSTDLVQGESFSVKIISEVYQEDAVVSLPAELEDNGGNSKVANTYIVDPATSTTIPVSVNVPNSVEGAASVSVKYVSSEGAASSDKITLDLSMTSTSGGSITNFGSSVVTVSLTTPYPIGSVVYGGTEAHDFTCVANTSGTYDVSFTTTHFSEFVLNGASVMVGEEGDVKYYSDLAKAVAAASDGTPVTLIKDVQVKNAITLVKDQVLYFKLNGKCVMAEGAIGGALFIIDKGTSGVSITIVGDDDSSIYGPVVWNKYNEDFKLSVIGGSYHTADDYAFCVYGAEKASFEKVYVDAYCGIWLSSKKVENASIKDCKIDSLYGNGIGIYLGTVCTATISNTVVNADETALEIKSGNVLIEKCTFTSKIYACDASYINHNGSGAGVAAVVINNAYSDIGCATNVTIDDSTVITNSAEGSKQLVIVADKERAEYNIIVDAVGRTAGIAFVNGSKADITFNGMNVVASANGAYYGSFADAFKGLNGESGKITILDSHETEGVVLAKDQKVELNLNGKVLRCSAWSLFDVRTDVGSASLMIDGTIKGSTIEGGYILFKRNEISSDFDLTVNGGEYVGTCAFIIYGAHDVVFKDATFDVTEAAVWCGNEGPDTIKISNCNVDSKDVGLYLGTIKDATLENNTVVSKNTAVEIKSGVVKITSGSYKCSVYEKGGPINGNGTGAGTSTIVINNGYANIPNCGVNVSISGVTLRNDAGDNHNPILIVIGPNNYDIVVTCDGGYAPDCFANTGAPGKIIYNNVVKSPEQVGSITA